MKNKVWSGRVEKHLADGMSAQTMSFGKLENEALREHYYAPLEIVADEIDAKGTIRDAFIRHYQVSNKLLAQARLTEHGLTINEERVYISAPVEKGEVLRLRMQKEYSEDIKPEAIPLDILFEDEYLLVLNKPPGIVVHPTHGHYTGTLANGVVHYWQQKGQMYRFRPIHRLDEETSGIVVVAKNSYIHQQLSDQLQTDQINKEYLAVVYGCPTMAHSFIEGSIDRDPLQPHLRMVTPNGYPSKTEYTVLECIGGNHEGRAASIIRLKLYTGRTHQIRVHMSSIGHPLIGDKLYTSEERQIPRFEAWIHRHALHANRLSLIHPMNGQRYEWVAPIPADIQSLINHIKNEI